MAESIRVGTLLGATMIVAGAYQKAASQVRAHRALRRRGDRRDQGLGEGRRRDRRLPVAAGQDHRRAGASRRAWSKQQVQHFAKRVRPKVKSFKAIELYGDAVTQTDDKKKARAAQAVAERGSAVRLRLARSRRARAAHEAVRRRLADTRSAAPRPSCCASCKREKDPMQRYTQYSHAAAGSSCSRGAGARSSPCRAPIAADPPKLPPAYAACQRRTSRRR